MKVLLINGSPNLDGCTNLALNIVADSVKEEGMEVEILQLGKDNIRDCTACMQCRKLKKCVFEDQVNEVLAKIDEYDAIVAGSPVYFSHPSGNILAFMNRLFYAGWGRFSRKVGASVVSARRAGTTSSLDVLNKHFLVANMFVSGSTYWNMVHGSNKDQVLQDEEGVQTMHNLGKNIAFLVKSIKTANLEKPTLMKGKSTNFIR